MVRSRKRNVGVLEELAERLKELLGASYNMSCLRSYVDAKTGEWAGENPLEEYESCVSAHYACGRHEKGGGRANAESAEDVCTRLIRWNGGK
jgi:hypothetical protein